MSQQRRMRIGVWTAVTIATLGVFAMYVQPDFLVVLSNQVWACF